MAGFDASSGGIGLFQDNGLDHAFALCPAEPVQIDHRRLVAVNMQDGKVFVIGMPEQVFLVDALVPGHSSRSGQADRGQFTRGHARDGAGSHLKYPGSQEFLVRQPEYGRGVHIAAQENQGFSPLVERGKNSVQQHIALIDIGVVLPFVLDVVFCAADQRACIAAIENLWSKYAVTAKQIETDRDAAAQALQEFLVELGYE